MKLTGKLLLIGFFIVAGTLSAYAWGQKGHDVTCAIAQEHLSNKAKKQISRILDGKSIVYWANWMDSASNTEEFKYSKTWHYKNIDPDESYDSASVNPSGDVLSAIETQTAALRSGKLNKEQSALALKMIVHYVGDLHCPMHMGHKCDLGGNKVQLQYFGKGSNLHKVWDSGVVESAHAWSCSEWVKEIDVKDREEVSGIASGMPSEWGRESYEVAKQIYEATPAGSKLSYDYVSDWGPVVEDQLLKGGIRLATLLNSIFK